MKSSTGDGNTVTGASTTRSRATTHPKEMQEEEHSRNFLCGNDSEQTPTMSVIMPILNEEAGITEGIKRIERAVLELEVLKEIIISDSFSDRTLETLIVDRSNQRVIE